MIVRELAEAEYSYRAKVWFVALIGLAGFWGLAGFAGWAAVQWL